MSDKLSELEKEYELEYAYISTGPRPGFVVWTIGPHEYYYFIISI